MVNKKMRLSAEGIYMSVFLSLFSLSETKIFGQIVRIKKHFTIDILKEGTNIFYRLLLIIVLVISLLKM